VPVLVITRRTLAEDGRTVEVAADIVLPADRVILHYRLELT
jgi:hypothetical protein